MAGDHSPDKTPENASATPQPIQPDISVIKQARAFLASPLMAEQPIQAKRQFLLEKGLTESQIELLLRQIPPPLPPPTYPQPAPSGLPMLLLGILKLFSYTLGVSSAAVLVYYRFLFPRIVKTSQARLSLKLHQLQLLRQLKDSIITLKDQQAQSFAVLPKPIPFKEPQHLAQCHGVLELKEVLEKTHMEAWKANIPAHTFLRCAIEELSKQSGSSKVSTEAIFECLETQIGAMDTSLKGSLWETLNHSPCFISTSIEGAELPEWSYEAPQALEPTLLSHSVDNLVASLSEKRPEQLPGSPSERLMGSLSTLTGYLSATMYSTSRSIVPGGKEDEIRKEIRALKGLSLNRKSFVTSARTTPVVGTC